VINPALFSRIDAIPPAHLAEEIVAAVDVVPVAVKSLTSNAAALSAFDVFIVLLA
jgi:hypothetical protein